MSWLNRLRKEQQADEVAGRAEHGGDLSEFSASRLTETLAEHKEGRLELSKPAAGRIFEAMEEKVGGGLADKLQEGHSKLGLLYDKLIDAGAKLIGDMATSIRHEVIERPTYGRNVTPEKVEIGVHGAPETGASERTVTAMEKAADALGRSADAPAVSSPGEGLTDADKRWLEHAMDQHERREAGKSDLYGPDVDGPEAAGMDR